MAAVVLRADGEDGFVGTALAEGEGLREYRGSGC
jgi:hypothetical protein